MRFPPIPPPSPRVSRGTGPAALALALTAVLAACADAPAVAPDAGAGPPLPTAGVAGGGYRLTFDNVGTPEQTATIVAEPQTGRPSGVAASRTGIAAAAPGDRGLTVRPNATFPLQFQVVATGTYSYGTRGTSDAYRYVYAMYRVRNASAATLQNLVLLGAASPATLGATAISSVKLPGDVTPAPATGAALAQGMLPAGTALPGRTGSVTALRTDVLHVFPEPDVAAASLPSPYVAVPYGFAVLDTVADGRTIAPSGTSIYPAIIAFAFRLPLQATASEDVLTFSFNFYAVTDAETRLTQSTQELDAAGASAVSARAGAIGATALHVFRESSLTGSGIARTFCSIRTAGTQGAPTRVLGTGCAGDFTGLSVGPAAVSIGVGASQALTPNLTVRAGATPPTAVAYASANPGVATVSASGLVTGVAAGTTTVYVGPYATGERMVAVPVTVTP